MSNESKDRVARWARRRRTSPMAARTSMATNSSMRSRTTNMWPALPPNLCVTFAPADSSRRIGKMG